MKLIKTLVSLAAIAVWATACGSSGPKNLPHGQAASVPTAAPVINVTPGAPDVLASPNQNGTVYAPKPGRSNTLLIENDSGLLATVIINNDTDNPMTVEDGKVRKLDANGNKELLCYVRVGRSSKSLKVSFAGNPNQIINIGPPATSAPAAPAAKKP